MKDNYLSAQSILSPAKINLMLRILGQRGDGYHQLQTCFQLLDWGDVMTFERTNESGSNQLHISGFAELEQQDNLIYKAAMMLKPWAQNESDWTVKVEKNIPLGAGLGGGSSNAATTLKFLNEAWQCDLSLNDLLVMALKLGADVPVFVLGRSALANGIGEILSPVKFSTPYVLLLFSDTHINTAELFKVPSLVRNQRPLEVDVLQQKTFWINDFFPVVLANYTSINVVYQALKNAMNLRLSGTGATMYALFDDRKEAEQAQQIAVKICNTILVEPKPYL